MPDPNKFKAISNAGFQIFPTCSRCQHFRRGQDDWGTCKKITYSHSKHTGKPREASVTADGNCPQFRLDLQQLAKLGAHNIFWKDD